MPAVSRIGAFVFLGLLLHVTVSAAQDKDKDADKPKEKPAEKWIKVAIVTGKVVNVVEAKKSLRIELGSGKYKKQVEWQSTDDVKVRFDERALSPKFDDKGRVKRYTRKDLNELKGEDKKTPGYPAEFSDLKQGQIIQVTLVRKKGSPKRVKGADPDPSGEYLPHMSLIVILVNPQQ